MYLVCPVVVEHPDLALSRIQLVLNRIFVANIAERLALLKRLFLVVVKLLTLALVRVDEFTLRMLWWRIVRRRILLLDSNLNILVVQDGALRSSSCLGHLFGGQGVAHHPREEILAGIRVFALDGSGVDAVCRLLDLLPDALTNMITFC